MPGSVTSHNKKKKLFTVKWKKPGKTRASKVDQTVTREDLLSMLLRDEEISDDAVVVIEVATKAEAQLMKEGVEEEEEVLEEVQEEDSDSCDSDFDVVEEEECEDDMVLCPFEDTLVVDESDSEMTDGDEGENCDGFDDGQ